MSITSKIVKGKKFFEVYVSGKDARGRRVQRRRRSIESIRQAEDLEFEFEREFAKLREEGVPYTWQEWFEIAMARMKNERTNSTICNYQAYLGNWVTEIQAQMSFVCGYEPRSKDYLNQRFRSSAKK